MRQTSSCTSLGMVSMQLTRYAIYYSTTFDYPTFTSLFSASLISSHLTSLYLSLSRLQKYSYLSNFDSQLITHHSYSYSTPPCICVLQGHAMLQLEADIANLREISELQEARCIELNAMLGDRDQTLEISQVRTLYRTAVYFTSLYFNIYSQPHYFTDSFCLSSFSSFSSSFCTFSHHVLYHQYDCYPDHCLTHNFLPSSPLSFFLLFIMIHRMSHDSFEMFSQRSARKMTRPISTCKT